MYKIYYFYGEEDFLMDEEVKRIILKAQGAGFSIDKFDGRLQGFDVMLQSLLGDSLFGSQKLILIDNFDQIKGAESISENFLVYLKQIGDDRIVVLTAKTLDKRKKSYKLLNSMKGIHIFEFRSFAPWEEAEVINWITQRVAQSGKKIDRDSALYLFETAGRNLRFQKSEIEKIITYIGNRDAITKEDIKKISSRKPEDVFALLSALGSKQAAAAVKMINQLLLDGEEPLQILGLLATQYRLLLQMKTLGQSILSSEQAARALSASPYFVKKTYPFLKNFSLSELKAALTKLADADLDLKRSGRPPHLIFELLFTDLC
jgi:DNA polymerase-3 subunit delta